MIVEMLASTIDDYPCNPASGISDFLLAAREYSKEKLSKRYFLSKRKKEHYNNDMFTGYDMGRTMLHIGTMNMMTHGVDNPNIEYKDSPSYQNEDEGNILWFWLILLK